MATRKEATPSKALENCEFLKWLGKKQTEKDSDNPFWNTVYVFLLILATFTQS
jgi:hypothetical protein